VRDRARDAVGDSFVGVSLDLDDPDDGLEVASGSWKTTIVFVGSSVRENFFGGTPGGWANSRIREGSG
jgi:hypothetical protein